MELLTRREKLRVQEHFWYLNKGFFVLNKGSIAFKHLCKYCIVLDTQRSDDVREECLECHMTSNDVRQECLMTGRCVNKPVQTEPVGCYENTFISNFTQLCK